MDRVDCVVIGAGVVGLAIARALAISGRDVLILEAEDTYGCGISSRNSEVIHAGIYYPQGSLKARLCVEGRKRLYAYCDEKAIPYSRCGKLIVATDTHQLSILQEIEKKALNNGVDDIRRLTQAEANVLEPSLYCVGALHSPSTGIIDSHGLMTALLADAEAAGAILVCRSPVIGGCLQEQGIQLNIGGESPVAILAKTVVNSAGLGAQAVASAIQGIKATTIPPLSYAKGSYFSLSGKSPFSRLIYPVPEAAGLGVHLTLDLGGQAKFGPDVEWTDSLDYKVDPLRADLFYGEIRRYWSGLPDNALMPAYAGIRPKPHTKGAIAQDFIVSDPHDHGVINLINLFGIESPGLTASLALAEFVVGQLNATVQ